MIRRFLGIFLSLLLLSGCGFGVGLNERAVVQLLAIDREGEGVRVSVSILSGEENVIVSRTGKTAADALAVLEKSTGKALFLRDTQLILLGETLCESGIGSCMRYLTDGFELRPKALAAAVSGAATDCLAGAQALLPVLQDSPDPVTLLTFDRDRKASGGDGLLPLLTTDGNGGAVLSGGLILHKEKTSHRLRQEEMNDMMLLRGTGKETMVLSFKEGQAVIELDARQLRLRAEIVGDVPHISVTWGGGFEPVEWAGDGAPPSEERLEEAARQELAKRLENAIRTGVFTAGADLMQLDSTLRRDVPDWFRQNEAFWREHRETAVFYTDIRCRLKGR